MRKFQERKSAQVEAEQFLPTSAHYRREEPEPFEGFKVIRDKKDRIALEIGKKKLAYAGDYIIKQGDNEYDVMTSDEFEAKYQLVF